MAVQSGVWNDCLQYAALTDVGMRRANNQDSHKVIPAADNDSWISRGHVFIVADGMGAHAAGELASKLAVDNIGHLYLCHRELSPPEALYKAIHETNFEIHRRGEANSEFHNMGTTASCLVLLPQGAVAAHVGDSRVYRLRGNKYEQLTFDHSLVWELKAANEAAGGKELPVGVAPKNVITRSLGPKPHVQVDMEGPFPIEKGDVFLLCSDGLSGQVSDAEMAGILGLLPPKEAVQLLVDLANLRGGPDNITVLIAKVISPAMATGAIPYEPLIVGGQTNQRQVPLYIWLTVGVCALAAGLFVLMQQVVAAMLAVFGALAAAVVAVLQSTSDNKGEVALGGGRRLGKGPYTKTEGKVDAAFPEQLQSLILQLKKAAEDEKWNVDWTRIGEQLRKAEQLLATRNFSAAAREFGGLLSFFMRELRNQRAKSKPSDSSVDLV